MHARAKVHGEGVDFPERVLDAQASGLLASAFPMACTKFYVAIVDRYCFMMGFGTLECG